MEIISPCVWLYYRFPLSFREVEEMMLRRGVVVSGHRHGHRGLTRVVGTGPTDETMPIMGRGSNKLTMPGRHHAELRESTSVGSLPRRWPPMAILVRQ